MRSLDVSALADSPLPLYTIMQIRRLALRLLSLAALALPLTGCEEILDPNRGVRLTVHGPNFAYGEKNPEANGYRCVYTMRIEVERYTNSRYYYYQTVDWAAMRVHVKDPSSGAILHTVTYDSDALYQLLGRETGSGYYNHFSLIVPHGKLPYSWTAELTYYDPLARETRTRTFDSRCLDPQLTPPVGT
jgi:hypothetical protein